MKWPADRVERRPIGDLIPYARNARTHSPEQIAQLAASLREWGWTNPVLVDEGGTIIAGHGRVLAARELGFDAVPVMVAEGWSEAQKRAYVLADNQLALNAGWDESLYRAELEGLAEWGFDTSPFGFPDWEALGNGAAGGAPGGGGQAGAGSLAARFGVPPFSVLNAREGWWQDRKSAWIGLGIQSELGRGAAPGGSPRPLDRERAAKAAAPGGSPLPAADYSKSHARGNGRGRAIE